MLYSLDHINADSPYMVFAFDENTACFITDNGIKYLVGFVKETNIGFDNAYQLFIANKQRGKTIGTDIKIAQTVVAIVRSFFRDNQRVLVYFCDTCDRHQAARNRKFQSWFLRYASPESFNMSTETIDVEDNIYFASIIMSQSKEDVDFMQTLFHEYFQDLRSKLL